MTAAASPSAEALPRTTALPTAAIVLRAGAWPAVTGLSGVAVVLGSCAAAFPATATTLLPVCFALLAAAAAFALDEPASLVVDVTPFGPIRRTGIRALALLAPLAAGTVVILAAATRGVTLPWASIGLALIGNLTLGFTAACVLRTRTGEPGATAATTVVLTLIAATFAPQVAPRIHTFPAPGQHGPSSDHLWWTALALCMLTIAIAVHRPHRPPWLSLIQTTINPSRRPRLRRHDTDSRRHRS
jgi:hypothetical protein